MTNREKQILELIRGNPMIQQQEIAEILGIARPSVAVHITNLMKKGLIAGKGYILTEQRPVAVIGGANMDIFGFPGGRLKPAVSNPGRVETACGGVGRNIAENLGRLEQPVALLSVVGSDPYGDRIREVCLRAGVDVSRMLVSGRFPTSTYLAIQESEGEMAWAVSQMDGMQELTVEYLRGHEAFLDRAEALVLDANLSEEVLAWIGDRFRERPLWFDPVSVDKAVRIRPVLGSLYALKPNRQEAECLSGIPAENRAGLLANYEFFMRAGLRELWLSLGSEGVLFGTPEGACLARMERITLRNANGAGDALMAGAIDGYLLGLSAEDRVRFALAAAAVACESKETINPEMSVTRIQNKMDEVKIYDRIS